MQRNLLILGCSLTLAAGFAPSSVIPARASVRASAISLAPRVSLRKVRGSQRVQRRDVGGMHQILCGRVQGMAFPGGDSECRCVRVRFSGAGGSHAVESLIPGVCVSTQASGVAPLRMAMTADVKPMAVRSKLREDAEFLLPKDGVTIAERVRLSPATPMPTRKRSTRCPLFTTHDTA